MDIKEQIKDYIASQPESKRRDLETLHQSIMKDLPDSRLWFSDGKNPEGKVVSNPNIGYGATTIKYANATSREFYRIGLSANTSGISVYIMGLDDKTYLSRTFGASIGKATVTGYCIKFKTLADITFETLLEAIKHGMHHDNPPHS